MGVRLGSHVREGIRVGVWAGLLLLGGANPVSAATRVVITVDVESQALPLLQQVDAICADGSRCGLMRLVQMLTERGLRATFFLNVYEHKKWGDGPLREIARRLQAAGQDVGLHTHPHWVYDAGRIRMDEYTLDEQTAIVADGVKLLAEWTGRRVVSHRAGDYGADHRTLEALRRNGIVVDSSLFFGNPRSSLNGLGMPRNLPSTKAGVLEIPVTVYQRDAHPGLPGDYALPVASVRKIDPDWFVDTAEATAAIDAVADAGIPYLVVFLHSFSFLAADAAGKPPVANVHSMALFTAILDHIAARQLPVVTMEQIAQAPISIETPQPADVLPRVRVDVGVSRYALQRFRAEGGRTLAMKTVALTLAIAGALWIVRRGTRRAARPVDPRPAAALSGSKADCE